jgi:hypothetical protein
LRREARRPQGWLWLLLLTWLWLHVDVLKSWKACRAVVLLPGSRCIGVSQLIGRRVLQ